MIKLIPPGTKPSLTTTGSALLASALLGSVPMTTYAYDSPVHIFSVNDVMGGFDGSTYGPAGAVPNQTDIICGLTDSCPTGIAPVTDKQGVTLYPVDSEFGFYVVDFLGAATKSKDGDYNEGFVGNIESGGSVVGLKISNSATDTYKVKPPLGTWCQGLGGTSVKCSTEHYTVMEHVLTCHEVVPYRFADPLTGEQAELGFPPGVVSTPSSLDCSDAALDDNLTIIGSGEPLTSVIPADAQMAPNDNTTVLADIAVSEDYSVTLKDDGKPLYRWGGLIKRPNDIRLYARLALPEEWKVAGADFPVTRAHLIVNHWITNNPNDQLRPEDLENEAATGRKPSYEIDSEGNWTSTRSCYEGDGDLIDEEGAPAPDFLATGTYFKNVRDSVEEGDPLPFSSDLIEGFTNAYYTTIERDPFEWSYNTSTDPLVKQFVGSLLPNDSLGELVSGPRWRLRANKFGQDIPGLEIPAIECSEPPFTSENIKYEVGEPATTVINLLDWDEETNGPSPLSTSRGWVDVSANQFVEVATEASGTPVTTNGLPMTDDFDLAVYIKGDRKSTALFSAQLQIEYEGEGPVNGNDYDVSITAFAAPERVLLGEASTVSVTLSNSGPAVADGAVSILGTTNRGEVIGPFMEMFDGLVPGNPITLELPWTAPADKVTTITFDASVMASGDINPTNNEASAQTKVRRN